MVSQQANPYQTIVVTIMSLLAPKLLLDLRKEYYSVDERIELSQFWSPSDSEQSHQIVIYRVTEVGTAM